MFFLMILSTMCKSRGPSTPDLGLLTYKFTGTVTNAKTASPIANATVSVVLMFKTLAETTTDHLGHYSLRLGMQFTFCTTEGPKIIATATGYNISKIHGVDCSVEAQTHDFQLEPLSQ